VKGIILAGGSGTRLFPMTRSISKQLIPVYDKPTIYYPLSVLMLAGIREILIISTERDTAVIKDLFGNGHQLGLDIHYKVQKVPNGIAEAFILGEDFLNKQPCCLILGDNIFYGNDLQGILDICVNHKEGATVLAYHVLDPQNFGVVEWDKQGKVISLEEKPVKPKSNFAIPGLYFYDGNVSAMAKALKPSPRGELEITDLNKAYLAENKLFVKMLGRGIAWLDTGTPESLIQSSMFIQTIESRQGLKIACIEEIALFKKFIGIPQLKELLSTYPKSSYKAYLERIVTEFETNGGSHP
jgi:glucose-1-phosphate thymidylyltransferase